MKKVGDRVDQYRQLGNDILKKLYRYKGLTAQQMCIITQRSKTTIYNNFSQLAKSSLIDRKPVPFLGKGAKVYYLTPEGAKITSEMLREGEYFNPKEWATLGDNLLVLLTNNQFYCELIKATEEHNEAGLVDWYGKQATIHKYLGGSPSKGEEATVPDSYAVLQLPDERGRQLLHTVVMTGDETPMIIEDCLKNYVSKLKDYWLDQTDQVSILFLSHVQSQVKRIVDIWDELSSKILHQVPVVGVAAYQDVIQYGVFSSVWNVNGQMKSLDELPKLPHEVITTSKFIGKNPAIPIFTSDEVGGKNKRVDRATINELKEENGIVWNVN